MPSKRRRDTALRQGLSPQRNLNNSAIPRGTIFSDTDVETESTKENTRSGLGSSATTPAIPRTTIDKNSDYQNDRPLLQSSTPATTTHTITPPMALTRASTHQARFPPSHRNLNYACEKSASPQLSSQQQSIPTAAKRKSSMLREQSPATNTRQARSPPSHRNINYAYENSASPRLNSQRQSLPPALKMRSLVLREQSPTMSTRQARSPPSHRNINHAYENSALPQLNSQRQSPPPALKRKSSVLREQAPTCSSTNDMDNSKSTLIGNANGLDMTNQFLPRLKAKICEPQLLNSSYQVSDIQNNIMDGLFSLEGSDDSAKDDTEGKSGDESKATAAAKEGKPKVAPLMQKPAIEHPARDVTAAPDDLRKALENSQQTIEMVELETKKKRRMTMRHSVPTTPTTKKRMPLQEISLAELENLIAGGGTSPVGGRTLHSRTRSTSSVPSLSDYSGDSTL